MWYNTFMKKRGTSTKNVTDKKIVKDIEPQVELEPNAELANFIKDRKIDFQVEVFEDKYVHVPGRGFLFFDKPQLIYKAKRK